MVILLLEMSWLAWSAGGKVRAALRGALQSSDVRGQESLVVYFLSKYKFKQGGRMLLYLQRCCSRVSFTNNGGA